MVGHSREFTEIRDHLLRKFRPDDMCLFVLIGDAGCGNSVIVNTVFEEEKERFECWAWLTIGTQYSTKEIVLLILLQVDNGYAVGDDYELILSEEDEGMVCKYLYKALENRGYMIVLDDVRDVQVWERLRSSFPDQSNGSIVVLITNQKKMIGYTQNPHTWVERDGYFQSWGWFDLISAVIGEESGPISAGFEQAAKEISANCGHRRLALAKTLRYLHKKDKTIEQWREIAADTENPVFKVEDEISEVHSIKTELRSELLSHNWDFGNPREIQILMRLTNWIDFSNEVQGMKKKIYPRRFFSKMEIVSLWGMAGIGKTTYAKKILQDDSILCNYDHCVWVSLGPKYRAEDILIDILAQIYPGKDEMQMKEDVNLVRELCVQLSGKRFLIVFDDAWSKEPFQHLKSLFPDIKGRALVTTRLEDVADWGENDIKRVVRFLDEEESWTLLRQKVFAEGSCPPELEKAGRKIAEKCDRLPLLLHKVADQLLKVEQDPDYWNEVASAKDSSVFRNAHDEISKTLLPSYRILPQNLKSFFLYMGAFCERNYIRVSKLIDLLIAEGFVEASLACLRVLECRSVIMVQYIVFMKSCRLHSVFWHLCNTEATKNKFFHAMDGYDDCSIENLKSQRRLCIRSNTLLGIRDVQESMALATSAHSLLCVGPPHQYPVPISFGLTLMRVMDALAIRQYEFPDEVVKLFHLRYLGLTYWGELPASISKLWKLQYLIVRRYLTTKSSKNSSLLPKEIWDMKELRHLQIMGGCLPNPEDGAGLPNLTTLLDVSAQSCTREVLEMIPKLTRLGIRIELPPNAEGNSFDCLNNISIVCGLKSLKCVVVNPQFRNKVIETPPPAPISMFPSSLERLSLSGMGYPWEYMSMIGKLENLVRLKLKSYAFRGPTWVIKDGSDFKNLVYLLIEDSDLVHWQLREPSFTHFERVSIKHCYKLRELPVILDTKEVEIVDCHPLTVTWAEQMRMKVTTEFRLTTQQSWIDEKVHVAPELQE